MKSMYRMLQVLQLLKQTEDKKAELLTICEGDILVSIVRIVMLIQSIA